MMFRSFFLSLSIALSLVPGQPHEAFAADYPAPKYANWIAKDFKFQNGETLPELKLHYQTIGEPTGEPVLLLHGTAGSDSNFLTPDFAGQLFGPGQVLDAAKYFIILPDAIGTGQSTKPSDGARMKFPKYNYDDMVVAQYRLVTEGLGLKHLRLIIGNSMGGMQTWLWGVTYPDMMDGLAPMAAQPSPMSGRNWIMRRMLVEAIRRDPTWNNGDYQTQPQSLAFASTWFSLATSGGTKAYQSLAPSREKADKMVEERLAAPFRGDANDVLYQWEASADYGVGMNLEAIKARVLAINAEDDERNPPELGIMETQLKRVKNGAFYLVPASADTRGHGTTGIARFWKDELANFIKTLPNR